MIETDKNYERLLKLFKPEIYESIKRKRIRKKILFVAIFIFITLIITILLIFDLKFNWFRKDNLLLI